VVMAFTGEMDSMTRQDAEEKAKAAGAKVMGAVSGNTKYLVVGSHLDDGRAVEETSKYRKVLELKEKANGPKGKGKCPEILNEEQFLKLFGEQAAAASAPIGGTTVASSLSTQSSSQPSSQGSLPHRASQDQAKTSTKQLRSWVDAHAPQGFGELVGGASIVKKISEWLRDWDDVVFRGNTKKVPFKGGGGIPDNVNSRAILVSGPPGIGKTTTCRLVANLHGAYEVLEYNASDARGQKIIKEMSEGIADNTTINFGGSIQKKNPSLTKRAIIIMDEVDGMGGGDRGGNAALIKMIKKAKNPIMCICNDEHSQKIRSLSFSCYHLKFSRPTKSTIAQRCAQIAKMEGLDVEPNALEALAESCGGDMRMVLNQLQILSKTPVYKESGIKYTDMRDRMNSLSKDQSLMLSPFDACKKLLNKSESARMAFREKLEMFFVDHSLVGMLVQENMFRGLLKEKADAQLLNRCAYAADLMTVGDMMNKRVAFHQEWGLLPHVGITSCVFPASLVGGFMAFPSFPSYLGKYSTIGRMRRLATELQAHVRLSSTVKRSGMITGGYADLLYRRAVRPLVDCSDSAAAVDTSVAVLDAYGLRREHLAEHLTELSQHLGGDDLFKIVDSKVKAGLTRELNTGGHAVKVMLPASKKRKVEANMEDMGDEGEEGTPEAEQQENDKEKESDDEGGGSLIKVKGKSKAKAKAKNKSKADDDGLAPAAKSRGRAKGKSKAT